MARGRNQNRGHNHQIPNTQLKNFPLNQQQQQQTHQPKLLPQSVSVHQQPNRKATTSTTTTLNETTNIFTNAPVANINKQQCSNWQSSDNKKATNPPSINSESYGHNNKTYNTSTNESQSNNNYDVNCLEASGGVEDLNTHLETNNGPAIFPTTQTTYQMTMSNNSCENFSQVKVNGDDDSSNEDHHNDDDVLFDNYSYSANESAGQIFQQNGFENVLNNDRNEEHDGPAVEINRSPVIEQNVGAIASVTENSNVRNKRLTASHNGNSLNAQFNNSAECDRDSLLIEDQEERDIKSIPAAMGQKNTKGNNTHNSSNSSSSTQTPSLNGRSLRESSVSSVSSLSSHCEGNTGNNYNQKRGQSPSVDVPTITVEDCSSVGSQQIAKSYDSNKTDEFYDFEIEPPSQQEQYNEFSDRYCENKDQENTAAQKANSSYGSQRTPSPTSMYSRYNYMKLEDVEEEDEGEEAEDEEEEEEEEEEEVENLNAHEDEQKNLKEEQVNRIEIVVDEQEDIFKSNNNLDNEYRRQNNNKHSNSLSPERLRQQQQQQLNTESTYININNSNNNSDCNLSTSFPDSGMGDSLASSSTNSRYINTNETDFDANSSKTMQQQERAQENEQKQLHIPFVRDGYSTDCDETLTQCDELLLDFAETPDYLDPTTTERLVCIESISLPDVVVESTNSSNATSTNSNHNAATSSLLSSSSLSSNTLTANSGIDRDYININGATGTTLSSVHFIPVHIEGSKNSNGTGYGGGSGRSSPRKQSVDDSLVGSSRATIEIIEDATELQHSPASTRSTKNNSDIIAEELK